MDQKEKSNILSRHFAASHAFLVGINRYDRLGDLNNAANDAQGIARVLQEEVHGYAVHPPLLVPRELNNWYISRLLFQRACVARRSRSFGYAPSSRLGPLENNLPNCTSYLIPEALDVTYDEIIHPLDMVISTRHLSS